MVQRLVAPSPTSISSFLRLGSSSDVDFPTSPAASPQPIHPHQSQFCFIEPRNTRMRRVMDRVRRFAQLNAPVLVEGERGSGKNWIAHLIHHASPHAHAPMHHIACGENPDEILQPLLQSILAAPPTPTDSDSPAIMLVLDEIEKLTVPLQEKLLQAIELSSSAATQSSTSKLRLIALTRDELRVTGSTFNRNLAELLNKSAVVLPPLRERREDILVLADYFLNQSTRENHRTKITFTSDARQALMSHRWPANIRELRAVVERAATIVEGSTIDVMDLALRYSPSASHPQWEETLSLDVVERTHIQQIIRSTSTPEEAARLLKVDILTLLRKRRRYGL